MAEFAFRGAAAAVRLAETLWRLPCPRATDWP
jgi:hypothetical protein